MTESRPDGLLAELGLSALTGALDAVIVIDEEGRLIEMNPAGVRMFGLERAAVLGRTLDWLVPPEHRAAHHQAIARIRETGVGHILGLRLPTEALHASGARVPVELTLSRFVVDGRTYFLSWLRDMSEQRRVAEAFEQARTAAVEANAAKSDFLARMSHEIRTPLGALMGFAELLERRPDRPERSAWARQLGRNARHLLSLLNDILDISKIEAGEMALELAPVSLFEVMADLDGLLRPLAAEKRLDLTIQVEGEVPDAIETEPLRLRQILINLVSNAIKYTDKGGVDVRAEMLRQPGDRDRLRVAITDSGIGITPEGLAQLFKPFKQLERAGGRRVGTGLGLSIARQLARLLGGDLTVESTPGRGSTFSLELPVRAVRGARMIDSAVVQLSGFVRPEGEVSLVVQGRRILVVDDHDSNRELARYHLEALGAVVELAEDGEEAVRLATASPFDVILMDMAMPGLDGYGATRRLRAGGCGAKIIALTAHAMVGDRTTCLAAGCDEYLSKPIEPRALRLALERVLGGLRAPARPSPSAEAERAGPSPAVGTPARSMAALIAGYVEDLGRTALALERALDGRDANAVRLAAHRLSGTATSFGFGRIGELARRCDESLRSGAGLEEAGQVVRDLVTALREASA